MISTSRAASLAVVLSGAALLLGCTFNFEGDPRPPLDEPAAATPTPETKSLFGQPLFAPEFDAATRTKLEERLNAARDAYGEEGENSDSADAVLDVGRRMGDLGMWRGAKSFFDEGVTKHEDDARLRDARGIAQLALRAFPEAEADFADAAALADRAPNASNPEDEQGALVWRTHCHLGIAHFVRGDFAGAAREFSAAEAGATNSDELLQAVIWGMFASDRTARRDSPASMRARKIEPTGAAPQHSWSDVLRLYRGEATVESLLPAPAQRPANAPDVDVPMPEAEAILRYGIANWFATNGRRDEAIAQLEAIVKSDRWADPCAVAAEADLRDLARLPR